MGYTSEKDHSESNLSGGKQSNIAWSVSLSNDENWFYCAV